MTTLSEFSEVTVTRLMQNQYFFYKSSDLPSIMLTFHPRSHQISPGQFEKYMSHKKSIHFAFHTKVDLKSSFCDPAKRPEICKGFRREVLHFLKTYDNPIRV